MSRKENNFAGQPVVSGKGKTGTSVLARKKSQMTEEEPREIELLPWITAFGIEACLKFLKTAKAAPVTATTINFV